MIVEANMSHGPCSADAPSPTPKSISLLATIMQFMARLKARGTQAVAYKL
jgi:hypothetical protein